MRAELLSDNKYSNIKASREISGSLFLIIFNFMNTEVQKAEKNFYGNDNLKGYLGITEILKVELMHRIADTYGPLVYHQLGETPRVYGQQEAYTNRDDRSESELPDGSE